MRLVIDLQGAQSESRFRGIGRYSLSLAQALARNRGSHQVILALNGLLVDSIDAVRAAFDGILPQQDIRVWHAPGPTFETDPANRPRRQAAERIREAFLLDLRPDAVLITSLFEGMGDDAVTSAGVWARSIPTAAVLYDLIPLVNPDVNFRTNPVYMDWYAAKVESLRRCELLLAISESSRQEAMSALPAPSNDVVNVFGACDAQFVELGLDEDEKERVRRRAGIARPFVMYTGGADERKNLQRLLEAFARLPSTLRKRFQLALIGRMPVDHIERLKLQAIELGVNDDVVFTGYVTDQDLVRLYNSCELFVFPSTHEGLGLPPMEAIACGAPVIAANVTSLPEVLGDDEALFSPFSVESIAGKLEQALSDDAFRQQLIQRGREHVSKFSWDETGRRAWRALERFAPTTSVADSGLRFESTSRFRARPLRILLQKLDHRGDLILAVPAVAKLRARYPNARLEALVGSWNTDMASQLGLFAAVHRLDFYRPASAEAPELEDAELDAMSARLGRFDIAIDLRRQPDTRFVLARIDAALRVGYATFDPQVDAALSVCLPTHADVPFETTPLNRMHASEQMIRLVDALPSMPSDFIDLPALAQAARGARVSVALFPAAGNDVKQWPAERFAALARRLAGAPGIDGVNVYFGSQSEADAFRAGQDARIATHVGLAFRELSASLATNHVCVANNSFGAHIAGYLGCTVIGVYGGHETAAEWSPPFGDSHVLHTGALCSPCHIASTGDCPFGMACLVDIGTESVFAHVIDACAGKLAQREGAASPEPVELQSSSQIVDKLLTDLSALQRGFGTARQQVELASAVSRNHRLMSHRRQLLVDVSELAVHDARSGIQRVVRAILTRLFRDPPEGFTIEPVYATPDQPQYRYARAFRQRFLGETHGQPAQDLPADAWPGDVFLGLDLHSIEAQESMLKTWRRQGVKVCFVVYDLLPVLLPDAFPRGAAESHQRWLESISGFDAVVTISRSVADEYVQWLKYHGPSRLEPLRIGWFHLGSDIGTSAPSTGLPPSARLTLAAISAKPTFLMIGTLEPRKGHAQVLDAFEQLWRDGVDANLVIVGKTGWLVEPLVRRLRAHAEQDRRLFWVEGASDEYLERIYAASAALVAASLGEGFGLPLVEAAQHRLPLIARDIPVFREVAGEHAFYFPADSDAQGLAGAIREWLALHADGDMPPSDDLRTIDWEESTRQLLDGVLGDEWPQRWQRDGVRRFHGADSRLHSSIGERRLRAIHSAGVSGHLIFGPYIDLEAGSYRLRLFGAAEQWTGREWIDIVYDSGRVEVLRRDLKSEAVGPWERTIDFVIDSDLCDLEVRMWVSDTTIVSLEGIEISPSTGADEATVQPEQADHAHGWQREPGNEQQEAA